MHLIKINKKAVVFTMDAMFALFITLSFFIFINDSLSEPSGSIYSNIDLLQLSNDGLAVLEKSGILENSIKNLNNSELQIYLNGFPEQICGNITLYNSINLKLLSAVKSSCAESDMNAISRRIFISKSDIYLAVMEVWYFET